MEILGSMANLREIPWITVHIDHVAHPRFFCGGGCTFRIELTGPGRHATEPVATLHLPSAPPLRSLSQSHAAAEKRSRRSRYRKALYRTPPHNLSRRAISVDLDFLGGGGVVAASRLICKRTVRAFNLSSLRCRSSAESATPQRSPVSCLHRSRVCRFITATYFVCVLLAPPLPPELLLPHGQEACPFSLLSLRKAPHLYPLENCSRQLRPPP